MTDNYWERKRFQVGRKKTFQTPSDLWKAAVEYFKWVEDNPLYEEKAFAFKGDITITKIKKMRAMSIARLCSFVGIDYSNYTRYRKNEKYASTVETIDSIIREQKFEGAAAGLFNANIIARDLGLRENIDQSSKDGTMTPKESKNTIVLADDVKSVLDMI